MGPAISQKAEDGVTSRTSILVAAAMAFASRDLDGLVRNPDSLADRLFGPSEPFGSCWEHCKVIEIDAPLTQQYKRQRLAEVDMDIPANLTYGSIDFAKHNLIDVLRAGGLREDEKKFYTLEGVSMYLLEQSLRRTVRTVASHSAPGSSLS